MKQRAFGWVVFVLWVLILHASPTGVAAKSYSVDRVAIEARLSADGAVHVVENMTYRFDGTFSYAYRDIPLAANQHLSDVRVSEGGTEFEQQSGERAGTFSLTQNGKQRRITWWYRARNEPRTFTLSYTMHPVVARHADIADFEFKFIGEGWEKRIGDAEIVLRLPPGVAAGDVRAWAHGPLNGSVQIGSDATIRFRCAPVPPRTFFEGRVVLPAQVFDKLTADGENRLNAILAEEAGRAERANAMREQARARYEARMAERAHRSVRARRLAPVAILLGLAGLGFWLWMFMLHGRPHPVTVRTPPGEIPSTHPPAVLSYLLFSRQVTGNAIVATLLDLADRGYLEIHETRTTQRSWLGREKRVNDYDFYLSQKPVAELATYERDLLDFLLNEAGDGTQFSMLSLKKAAAKKRSKFRKWFLAWIKAVKKEGQSLGFYEPYAVGAMVLNAACGIVVAAAGVFVSVISKPAAGLPAVIMGGTQLVLTLLLQRHTPEGRRLALAWRAFAKHIDRLAKGASAARLGSRDWSRTLAVAILFGKYKKLIPRIEMVDSHGRSVAPVWYYGLAGGDGASGIAGMANGLTAMVGAVSSTMSSASGSGGGASAGGGGGSGGGGGGAG